jgi:hypothetical protein
MKKTVDVLNSIGFVIEWRHKDHWCDLKVFKIEWEDSEGRPCFWRQGSDHNGDATPEISEAEPYIEGFVKWDGCSEFDGRVHFCGPEHYRDYFELLQYIYERAFVLMGRKPDEPW